MDEDGLVFWEVEEPEEPGDRKRIAEPPPETSLDDRIDHARREFFIWLWEYRRTGRRDDLSLLSQYYGMLCAYCCGKLPEDVLEAMGEVTESLSAGG